MVNDPILGRRVYGGRPGAWLALEDKLVAEEIWAAVGYPRAPSRVVDVKPDLLRVASTELDQGHCTVWAGDARDGFNGGGDFVRWVVTEAEQGQAFDFFSTRCDRVRVMPFLEGVPCSIHGIVLPDGTAAFRPVELAILRAPATRTFVYGGQGTSWDPPEVDREEMRDLVRSTGEQLRALVGYRGAFGIDGILTADGFAPAEINTRLAGGLANLARGLDPTLFTLLQLNLVAGRHPRVTVDQLESWALPLMDGTRIGKPLAISDRRTLENPTEITLTWDGECWSRGDPGDGSVLQVAPSAIGTFAKVDPCPALRVGDRLTLLNVALLGFLDDELGTAFGQVEAAPDLSRRSPRGPREGRPATYGPGSSKH